MAEYHIDGIDLSSDRGQRGAALLKRIGGADFDGPVKRLAAASADMARVTIEFPYGEILSRPGLDLRLRQICTVSVLVAHGSAQPQLKFHMDGLLNVGGEPRDLIEIAILSTAILGFPAALDAISVIRQIFAERGTIFTPPTAEVTDGTDRYRRGLAALRDLIQAEPSAELAALRDLAPELERWTVEFAFGDVLARGGWDAKARQFASINMLATAGNRADALRLHLAAALNCGATREEISEAFIQLGLYAGFPTALNAFALAREVLDQPRPVPEKTAADTTPEPTSENNAVRRERGLAAVAATSGASGDGVLHSFDGLAPEVADMIVDHCYGDIFHRPALDPKTRELTTCAALAGRGSKNIETPLRVHINAALNAGASRAEIVETLLNILPYSGYPAVQQAMRIAREEMAKRD